MEEIITYLDMMLRFAVWSLKNPDTLLGGVSIAMLVLGLTDSTNTVLFVIMAVVCIGIRVARWYCRSKN